SSPTGAATYNYKIIACSKARGCTAASPVTTITNGLANLGARNVGISTLSRVGQTVTITTSAAHELPVGCSGSTCPEITIDTNGISDGSWAGKFRVASVADATHFTYVGGNTTANGAPTSATGGVARWYNCNHISWSAATNAYQYYVLSDRTNP